jgi:hypothetical protein
MHGLAALFFVLMQATSLPTIPLDAPQPAAPAPSVPRVSTTTSGGNTTVVVMPATEEDIKRDAAIAAPAGMDGGATATHSGLNKLARQSLQLPNYLLTRDKKTVLENAAVQTLNTSLRFVGLALWVICLALIIAKHLAGPFVGADIMDLSVALPVGIFMGMLGWFNQQLLGVIIDLAGAVITGVVNAPLSEAITPGLSFNTASQLIIGPILGVVYDLLSIWLIFKIWLQMAWLWLLTAGAPIYVTITGAPFLGKFGSHWWRNWFGTLVDPILVIIGLHLAVPWFDLLKGAPDLASQLAKGLTFLVILSAVGWHPGAYRPQSPEMVLALLLWRMMRNRHATHSPAPVPSPPAPPLPPDNPHAVAGMGAGQWIGSRGGTGGGTAASWWKTGKWAVGGAAAAA